MGIATHTRAHTHLALHQLQPEHQSLSSDISNNLKLIPQLHQFQYEGLPNLGTIGLDAILLKHLTQIIKSHAMTHN